MISITCTHCSATLTMDEAFAGGVCRCQYCGTIQTVPAMGKNKGAHGGAGVTTGQQKALYQRRGRAATDAGSGLDELADIVASSGLSGSGLASGRLARPASAGGSTTDPTTEQPAQSGSMLPLIVGGGLVIATLIGVIVWLVMTKGGASSAGSATNVQSSNPIIETAPVPTPSAPSFVGIPLDANTIYVLDRGNSTEALFGYLKEATYRSIQSLGQDRKFQIVFWGNSAEAAKAYPALMTYATKENLAAVQRQTDDVAAFGQTDARTALELAVKQSPGAIVLATAKGWDLDDNFVKMVDEVLNGAKIKLHTVSLGAGVQSKALNTVAEKTGGTYHEASESELRKFAQ